MAVYPFNSPYFELLIDHDQGCWSISGNSHNFPGLSNLDLRIHYQVGNQQLAAKIIWEIESTAAVASLHGSGQKIRFNLAGDAGLHGYLTFFLLETQPLLLWQVKLENQGVSPMIIKRVDMLTSDRDQPGIGESPAFFSNGWQSWSYTGVYGYQQRSKRTRLRSLGGPVWYNPGTTRPRQISTFSSDMFGVLGDRRTRQGLLAGFLSQRQHFGSLQVTISPHTTRMNLWANGDEATLVPGAQLETDWACLQWVDLDIAEPLEPYLLSVGREHGIDPTTGLRNARHMQHLPESGWCSWYHYFQNLSAENIRTNLQVIQQKQTMLPLELVQIDDGYEAQIGDWNQFSSGFPEGVQMLAQEIKKAGLIPGLWISPFIVHPKSKLIQQHPDWLLRQKDGTPANAGWSWNAFCKALDLTHPEALQYAVECVSQAVHDWGFSYIKLDFLYSAAISGRYQDTSQTRAQVLRRGLQALREAAGDDPVLLGCGCPLGSAIGLVDAMRIAPDVSPRWLPNILNIPRIFDEETNMPSARNSIHNALVRSNLHRRWWINDPDCLLLRKETELSQSEMQFLATMIALTGSQFLLSDDLSTLPPERIHIAQALIPVLQNSARVIDWFDTASPCHLRLDLHGPIGNWHLLAVFNWHNQPRQIPLNLEDFQLQPDRRYLGREFWSSEVINIAQNQAVNLQAHGTALLAVRTFDPNSPVYLGSDLHISQGLEVTRWQSTPEQLSFTIYRPLHCQGNIYLQLPWQNYSAQFNGQQTEHISNESYCRIPVKCQANSINVEILKV